MSNFEKPFIEHLLYPAMEAFKGNHTRRKIKELQQTESSPDLPAFQRKQLQALLVSCVGHVPAYQQLGISKKDILDDPYAVLSGSIPPLRKTDFAAQPDRYLSDAVDPALRIANCTGGSTGQPVHFFMTRDQVESYEAARWRGLSWFGITPGSRCAMVWGNPLELSANQQKKQRLKERFLKNRSIISAYALTEKDVDEYVDFLNHYKPEYLYGYATILTAFAKMLQARGISPSIPLKAVVSTSETLSADQTALLSQVFHCPVANEYGARDAGILAYSCPCGKLHITAENCLLEVLDPITLQPLPAGQSGVLAITDLRNYVQPRLRYLLGDVGTISAEGCACGRTLPVLESLEGREDALLLGPNGKLVHGNLIGQLLRSLDGVVSFQFRQHTPETATLDIELAPGKTLDTAAFLPVLQDVLPNVAIDVQFVDHIASAASGKMRYAIREFPLTEA